MGCNMELTVLNKNLETIAIIDTFESLIWSDRYNSAGDFELYCPMSLDILNVAKQDYYLSCEESEHLMIIEEILITTDVENGNHLTITGSSLESILNRRIIWGQKVIEGNVQDVIHTLLDENMINPTIVERKIDNFIFEDGNDERITSLNISAQYMGDNLYDAIYAICEQYQIGFKITLNENMQFVFKLYKGLDRSYEQSENPYVVFSPDFDNIINSSYLESRKCLKNVVLVAGEGEGSSQKSTVVAIDSSSGLERREIFEDASSISTNVGSGQTLTEEKYKEQLEQKGLEVLADYTDIIAFEGEIEATRMFKYGEDFFIGDIVQIANEYGHERQVYISEFVMSQNEQGISMYPTFKIYK